MPHAFSSMPMKDRRIVERDLTLQPTKCRQENLPDVHTRLSVGLATAKSPAFVSGHCCATYRQRAKRMPVDRSASSTIHDEYGFQPNVVFDGSGPFTGASRCVRQMGEGGRGQTAPAPPGPSDRERQATHPDQAREPKQTEQARGNRKELCPARVSAHGITSH